jgi:hypothetical protein
MVGVAGLEPTTFPPWMGVLAHCAMRTDFVKFRIILNKFNDFLIIDFNNR